MSWISGPGAFLVIHVMTRLWLPSSRIDLIWTGRWKPDLCITFSPYEPYYVHFAVNFFFPTLSALLNQIVFFYMSVSSSIGLEATSVPSLGCTCQSFYQPWFEALDGP